ncbi:hypothetical protein ASPZODRAFT_107259 [Penicilliopsis zonata CBS 506.65]|uniref:Peptidase A1 domain-containing protein n=1 Tax=Penicilliopsis zonata CBS 506.65 TaxID=1073090 RepID=A0A1L9SV07_9EURO|nr:hypothetical protein ASPZODRAFT_107259 [Penicilliopsis zonata CBS 506.65]OJJ51062.1 hypothetical protein ASPZODRAFT_107259 [Penicilliopsis zonata CBS 506.65]
MFIMLALLALSSLASSLPTQPPSLSFSVSQASRPSQPINLAAQYANTLSRYGGEVSAQLKAAALNGTAVTSPEANDLEYLTPVTIGNVTFHLDFDTGSADLWVYSDELPTDEQTGHAVYATTDSKLLPGSSWEILYGDGSSAGGDVFADTVVVGGLTATMQAVEAAATLSAEFERDAHSDGLLGLAFSTLNMVKPQKQSTFFDNVKSQLDLPVIATSLKHGAPGTYDFGFIDENKYTGPLTYVDVDSSRGYWTFTADAYAFGDDQISTSLTGIADTGTTLILLPSDTVSRYYANVSGAQDSPLHGGYVFPCDSKLTPFTLVVAGNHSVTVPGELINYAPVGSVSNLCFGGIQAASGLVDINIFGDVFLKSQYVVFDAGSQGGPRLGFANQK